MNPRFDIRAQRVFQSLSTCVCIFEKESKPAVFDGWVPMLHFELVPDTQCCYTNTKLANNVLCFLSTWFDILIFFE